MCSTAFERSTDALGGRSSEHTHGRPPMGVAAAAQGESVNWHRMPTKREIANDRPGHDGPEPPRPNTARGQRLIDGH